MRMHAIQPNFSTERIALPAIALSAIVCEATVQIPVGYVLRSNTSIMVLIEPAHPLTWDFRDLREFTTAQNVWTGIILHTSSNLYRLSLSFRSQYVA
jgi:hypothetical protein